MPKLPISVPKVLKQEKTDKDEKQPKVAKGSVAKYLNLKARAAPKKTYVEDKSIQVGLVP